MVFADNVPQDVVDAVFKALAGVDGSVDDPLTRADVDAIADAFDKLAPHAGAKFGEFAARLRGTEGDLEHAEVIMDEFERWVDQQRP